MSSATKIYWSSVAHFYALLKSPLRPDPEDIRIYEETVATWHADHATQPLQALLCGVTPDIAMMSWPAGTDLLAVDKSDPMREAVWPGDVAGERRAVSGTWLDLPCEDSSIGVAIGDGSFNCIPYADGYRTFAAELKRVLRNDGLLAIRVYVRPDERESLETVFADLEAGRIENFHACKWRIAMAIQPDTQTGVLTRNVLKAWNEAGFNHADLEAHIGWPEAEIDTIKLYEDNKTRYSFPTLDELRAGLADLFEIEEIRYATPAYPLSERCPILVLRPR